MYKMLIGAGCFRFIALFAIRLFPAIFFARIYPEYTAEFSQYNALYLAIFGFIGSLFAGILSDKLGQLYPKTNPYSLIINASCLLSIPVYALVFLK